ncbi:unnamed protein product [Vitrella brassicaformis CCMP3155]|uniref:Uncharacterized protein n=1 Tax=Vitrella brassicaformis (strain CCMP3155) TaxID=1169540 RepID=A0A0G4FQD8_VITBC|nr:unnamed protein product [Vitrella brassicaformis CCMP3155]|mmetsp:Transcript_30656/g.76129  ORF Transcript_30656/g.76129 Transcript_30656/m.76129 type:complete len:117 (-) Transcript_30656:235-585(-)|eukprot:CEM16653.1 unnamed protein product [Vitrella brassicaformis CCMP3155]
MKSVQAVALVFLGLIALSHCFQVNPTSPSLLRAQRTSALSRGDIQKGATALGALAPLASLVDQASASSLDGIPTDLLAYDSASFGGNALTIAGLFAIFIIILLLAPPLKGEPGEQI